MSGSINASYLWENDTIVDTSDRWEMTVYLIAKAPHDTCTVTLTPRRCQRFKPKPGDKLNWTNTSAAAVVQTGKAAADKWGLVTLEKVTVTKGKNRIAITR